MGNSAQPFHLPQHLSLEGQIVFSLKVINNYRQELKSLRHKIALCQTHHDPLLAEVHLWKEKYQRERQEKEEAQKEVEKLKKEIERITKTKNRYQVGLFDHGNFHHPDQKDKKKNGGQHGHKDTNRDNARNYASFKKQRIFAEVCGGCGNPLSRVGSVKEKTLIDIQMNTKLIEIMLQSERQWCQTCRHEVTARSPQSLPFTEYGMNTFMMVMLLRFKSHQSIQKISTVLYLGFGLTLSSSGILSLVRQAKEYLRDKYEELKQAIRDGAVMYNDETGWLVHGEKAWMWIMANETTTVYVAAESRGKGIFEEMYGDSKAISMHDGYTSYESITGEDKTAYCWTHVLRFAFEETVIERNPTSTACQIRDRLVSLYQTIRLQIEWTREEKEAMLRREIENLITIPATDETSKNIQNRIATQKEGLIIALLVTSDGTNNLAERELRPMAIHRNLSFGSATFKGMETTAILGSVVQTISRDKEKQFLPTLKSYLLTGIQEKYPQYKHPPSLVP